MGRREDLSALRSLQRQIDKMRQDLDVTAPGRAVYMAHIDRASDRAVVVEADGFGGATLIIVDGDYPLDYLAETQKAFASELRAIEAADEIVRRAVMHTTDCGE